MTQPKPGHNITEKAFVWPWNYGEEVAVMCSCTANPLLVKDELTLQEVLDAVAEHNQKFVPTGVRL